MFYVLFNMGTSWKIDRYDFKTKAINNFDELLKEYILALVTPEFHDFFY